MLVDAGFAAEPVTCSHCACEIPAFKPTFVVPTNADTESPALCLGCLMAAVLEEGDSVAPVSLRPAPIEGHHG